MQITHNQKNLIGWGVRILILVVCAGFISVQIGDTWTLELALFDDKWGVIGVVSLLAVVNWALEVWRWKISLDTLGISRWSVAMQQVFGGLALNWVMPFTSGDLLARLLPHTDKRQVGILIYYNRAIMLGITLVFGGYGVFRYSTDVFLDRLWVLVLAIGLLAIVGWLLTLFLKGRRVVIQRDVLGGLLVLSMLRYAVFTFQFYVLLSAFNPALSFSLLVAGVGWIFLFRSVVPSLFGNLGVREAGALLFFEAYVPDMMLVLVPSLLIWLINTVAPSVLGLYFLLKFRVGSV